jgi:hypothetical protein
VTGTGGKEFSMQATVNEPGISENSAGINNANIS